MKQILTVITLALLTITPVRGEVLAKKNSTLESTNKKN